MPRVRPGCRSIERCLSVGEGYVGGVIDAAQAATGLAVEVTKRNEQVKGFVPVRKRWFVERTYGWLGRYRRTSKDYERYCDAEQYVIPRTMVSILLRRLAPAQVSSSARLQIRRVA